MLLNGDLNQMAIQKAFLQRKGYTFEPGIPPRITGSNFGGSIKGAIQLIWDNRIPGW